MGHTICYFTVSTFRTETTRHNENVSASPTTPLCMTKEPPTLHKCSAALENTQQSAKAVFVLSLYCPSFQQSIVLFLRLCSRCQRFFSTGSPTIPVSPKFHSQRNKTSLTWPTTSFLLPPSLNGWFTTLGSSCLKTWRFTPGFTSLRFGFHDASNPSYATRRRRSSQTKQDSTQWNYDMNFWKGEHTIVLPHFKNSHFTVVKIVLCLEGEKIFKEISCFDLLSRVCKIHKSHGVGPTLQLLEQFLDYVVLWDIEVPKYRFNTFDIATSIPCPPQKNGYDCGLFTAVVVAYVIGGRISTQQHLAKLKYPSSKSIWWMNFK